ncbi:MAG: hypothetical protein PHI33_01630 [Smithellaceae bacterium]|nr:hypothetical protein [Smithellaceae bacterium]
MAITDTSIYRIVGNTEIHQLRDERTWNPAEGVQTWRRFVGPAEKIKEYFNELTAAGADSGGDEIRESYNGQAGQVHIRVIDDSGGEDGGNTEELNAVWELMSQDIQKPIESHPDFDSVIAAKKREIEKKARDAESFIGGTDAETNLYAYYSNQVLDYIATQLILRKSITVSTKSAITLSYANLNTVVAIGAINPPSKLLGALTSLPKMDGTTGAWEWLKKGPQCRQLGRSKFALSYEWWGADRWAKIPYGGTWEPG